jgi:hypothetical protein
VLKPTVYEQTVALLYRHRAGLDEAGGVPAKSLPFSAGSATAAIGRLIKTIPADAAVAARNMLAAAPRLEANVHAWYQRGTLALDEATLARTGSIEQLTSRARAETSFQRQRLWIAAIVRRNTQVAVNTFLDLAGDPATSPAAFDAAREADGRTVDKLFEAMRSSRVATRQTAARVLGSLNNPGVSQRLAQMAMESAGRREALIGLLSSSDPVARRFLAFAEQNSELAPSVRALALRF